jgi:hypothetical protein
MKDAGETLQALQPVSVLLKALSLEACALLSTKRWNFVLIIRLINNLEFSGARLRQSLA